MLIPLKVFTDSRTLEQKHRLKELKVLISKRNEFEKALENWEYFNLITQEGYWTKQQAIGLENAVQKMLLDNGWSAKTTKKVGDGGIDLICEKNELKVFVQCKGHLSPLGVSAIRDAAGVKMAHNPHEMIVIAPNGFTKGSIEFANNSKIKLIDAKDLTRIADKSRDLVS